MRLRRSCLAVPASSPAMMEKGAGSAADLVFFDLEDACAPGEKVAARRLVVEALRTHDFGAKVRAVRVNDVTTPWCFRDVIEVVTGAEGNLDALIVPKVEDASHVQFIDHLLAGLEQELGLPQPLALEIQMESPRGAVNLREIAAASARVETIVFGPGDYAAGLGVGGLDIGTSDPRYPGHQWHWAMSEVANHARAFGIQPIDGPYADFNDEDAFRTSALTSKLLGFAGKWCIHPNQIPWANDVFSPTREEAEHAAQILEAYASALAEGRGAVAVNGKLVDEATRKIAEATIASARAAGIMNAGAEP